MKEKTKKPKLAFWFRYGASEHAELFHAIPSIIAALSEHFEVYYISLTSREKPQIPEMVSAHAHVFQLPVRISRRNTTDKTFKTLLWIALIPWIAAGTRLAGIRYVYVDETIPLVMPIGRLFFGNGITMTLADFFAEQYLSKGFLRGLLCRLVSALDYRAWRRAPFLIARSRSAGRHLAPLGIAPEKVFYAYDPIDEELYHAYDRAACRKTWGWKEEEIVMVYHGVLNPAKDLDTVLEALPEVIQEFPGFRFLAIGNGPDEARLKEKTRSLNLEKHVQFPGYVEPRIVATALGGGDIGLISRKADLGSQLVITSVLGHCLACGIAVLATRTDGIAELITDGRNGLMFEAGNVQEFREKLLMLCRDSTLRRGLADAGYQTVRLELTLSETVERNVQPFVDHWGGIGLDA
ncbi:MAG: glycosyltransferase [Kiritimatiellae bacterium]|nr:glycosyltransferase [Kiritimatiellia bacterium]MDD4736425.1 glycosyltransferase [Kiritimatiellia bacterium]